MKEKEKDLIKDVHIRNVDRELWNWFVKASRIAGYNNTGEFMNDVLLRLFEEFNGKEYEIRKRFIEKNQII